MWRSLQSSLNRLRRRIYRRRIQQVMALRRRSAMRPDGLKLEHACSRLEVCWRTRDVHPWDSGLPQEDRSRLFVEQTFADTEAALIGLFEALPQIDVIDLQVHDLPSNALLLSGTVHRSAVAANQPQLRSTRMRLYALGVDYQILDTEFETLLEKHRGE